MKKKTASKIVMYNKQHQQSRGRTLAESVPEETLTHSHPSWSSDILYHLPPFTTINGHLFVQFTCLTILSDNLSSGPLWSSSWSWTLNFILHAFLHPIIIIFSQHMPIPTQPVLLQYQWIMDMSSIPRLSLSYLLGSLSFSLTPHIHLTILIHKTNAIQ